VPTCSPWLDLDDPEDAARVPCDPDEFAPGVLAAKIAEASHLLSAATGGRWPGICTDTIRPCASGCGGVQYLDYSRGGARPLPTGGCRCGGMGGVGCTASGVALPRRPVVEVVEVKIDGHTIDPATYRLVDRSVLTRPGAG